MDIELEEMIDEPSPRAKVVLSMLDAAESAADAVKNGANGTTCRAIESMAWSELARFASQQAKEVALRGQKERKERGEENGAIPGPWKGLAE